MDEIPCNHDFLDPATTIVVQPALRLTWCIGCARKRDLMVLNEASRIAAMAAKEYMLFGGGTRDNN
jgi:hypothetical protein